MGNSKKKQRLLMVVGAVALLMIFIVIFFIFGTWRQKETKKIGYIGTGSSGESGWYSANYKGVKEACQELGVELLVKENIKEDTGACQQAAEELINEGAHMIILNSYGYLDEIKELTEKHKEVLFYANSAEDTSENVSSFFVRLYQGRYLAGILAGMKTETNEIGYVAAMPNAEVNRGINAFALGARSVNSKAEVNVIWTGSWSDAQKEKQAAEELVKNHQTDVLTYHQNQPNVIEEAERLKVYSIGFNEPLKNTSPKYLTCINCYWKNVYKEIIREYLSGKGDAAKNVWFGLEKDVIGLSDYSSAVTEDMIQEVEHAKAEILSGKQVFSGEIYDTDGNLRCEKDASISDEILRTQLDWYVEGVKIYE